MKLLGEQIDSEITMLASLGRGRDANDLARTTLDDQQIAGVDVMAGNGDGVWPSTTLDEADTLAHVDRSAVFSVDDNFVTLMTMMVWVEWMKNPIGGSLDAVTD